MTNPALAHRCEICGVKPGQPCRNTITPGEPLPGRAVHYARATNVDEKETDGSY